MLYMKFVATNTLLVNDAYIGETSQPFQHCLKQHWRSSYNGNDSAVFNYMISSGNQIDINEVTILEREEYWLEHGVKEAVQVRTNNPSLNCNGGTRITLSHSSTTVVQELHCRIRRQRWYKNYIVAFVDNGGTRITLSHSSDLSINILRSFS